MKKLILSVTLGLSVSFGAIADTVSGSVPASGAFTLLTGAAYITSVTVSGNPAGSMSGAMIDNTTNALTVATTAYTNIVSYLTNLPTIYTNYWGVLSTNADYYGTNWVLIDITNKVATNVFTYPIVPVAAAASTTLTISPFNQTFFRGICFTNYGTNPFTATVNYQRR